jgi:hypothetical protein
LQQRNQVFRFSGVWAKKVENLVHGFRVMISRPGIQRFLEEMRGDFLRRIIKRARRATGIPMA